MLRMLQWRPSAVRCWIFHLQKARRIVFNIVGGLDMGLQEINEASEVIFENADENANIIFGALLWTRI